ncbi:hypothetical protein [uncultured Fusobacterium sp.]|uniref:hypothetical protein n=1 Tax=uncultured Fusobacterium sp. TaxID=159267 RepID=UPI0025D6B9FF|nr:hypothetical protein [uncultured Fusobacterium sp.]
MNKSKWSDIEEFVQEKRLLEYLIKILEYENSKIHVPNPQYKETYSRIIEEALKDEN